MRKRGMPESILRKMVEMALAKEDVEALKKLLASMRKKILNHDADLAAVVPGSATALAPALSAPAASPPPPISRPVRRRRISAEDSCGVAPVPTEFIPRFRTFAFKFGKEKLSEYGSLEHVTDAAVYKAFRNSLPQNFLVPSLHHYFKREQWIAAVEANNIDLFQPGRGKDAVQLAATIPEKLELKPAIRPLVDWHQQTIWIGSQALARWQGSPIVKTKKSYSGLSTRTLFMLRPQWY
uniref:Uncharacterized protein n=1 Tax=Cryptomonas curvata TaxID=233186 RepID=A0A7S0MH24_9CRYP|mmetsp:Transcript_40958/g.85477  ORF Transcript_40958/g.85477 Transcript_40958/m.85477 type:complete len:238 (+) Transcript_40958:191-904(+)